VRPQRYTYGFVEAQEKFTFSWLGTKHQRAMSICGTLSGRNTDKVKDAGLNTIITPDSLVSFVESELIFECRKIYFQDLNPDNMLDKTILRNYLLKDFHRVYTGEILKIWEKKINL
jgi:flavin reductase (DIM6/NTAB) family NADH-FMN oxidoreductase RutF